MKAQEIKKDIYFVGAKDWNIRDFHGYKVPRGTSYNAYLIIDEKITLVDTVKAPFSQELLTKIKSIIDPTKIDYLICNHVEMDHSSSMPAVLEQTKNATVITDMQGKNSLAQHYDTSDWKIEVVKTGDTLNIGKRTLSFVQTPMLHWPDSMVTYIEQDKLLLPNDGFGQHIAADSIFANENPMDIIFEEAKSYYANILFPFPKQTFNALEVLQNLEIDMIAPAHGCIWQKDEVKKIQELYNDWASGKNENKAVIIYDTMWGSTEKMARSIELELESHNIKVAVKNLKEVDVSEIMTELIDSKYVIIGCSVLNNQILPKMAGFLNYMQGLKPHDKIGFSFGSYGWAKGVLDQLQQPFEALNFETPVDSFTCQYVPTEEDLNELQNKIKELVKK